MRVHLRSCDVDAHSTVLGGAANAHLPALTQHNNRAPRAPRPTPDLRYLTGALGSGASLVMWRRLSQCPHPGLIMIMGQERCCNPIRGP